MLKITCDYELLADGTYKLIPWENWRLASRDPVFLKGNLGQLWHQLLELSQLSVSDQYELLKTTTRKTRSKFLHSIQILKRGGLVSQKLDENMLEPLAEGVPRLKKIHLELTHRCNFKCKACYLGTKLAPASAARDTEISTQQWITMIQEAAALGCTSAVVTGGEPFLRSDIFEILEALTENGIASTINTNGSCITAKTAERLKPMLLETVDITLYGSDRVSAGIYTENGPGFSAAIKGVFHLHENDVPVSVKYFATQKNADGIEAVFGQMKEMGVSVALIGHAIHGDIFEGIAQGHEWVIEDLEKPNVIQGDTLPCHPTGTVLNIEPDGTIRACPKVSVHFGNVFREGLTHVWTKSQSISNFRNYWVDYTRQEGYVQGASKGSLCPASEMLSQPNGLKDFKEGWLKYNPIHV